MNRRCEPGTNFLKKSRSRTRQNSGDPFAIPNAGALATYVFILLGSVTRDPSRTHDHHLRDVRKPRDW
jgi:hypothetical protein